MRSSELNQLINHLTLSPSGRPVFNTFLNTVIACTSLVPRRFEGPGYEAKPVLAIELRELNNLKTL